MLLPPQRSRYGARTRTLLVSGGAAAVGDAVRTAERAGWDTWSVTRYEPARWRLTVARRG